jgi:alkyl sulfatase BDS1-like metallo-beta-lactamase superfamily hydrolase
MIDWDLALQTKDNICHLLHNLVVLTVALIASTPSWISANLNQAIRIVPDQYNFK